MDPAAAEAKRQELLDLAESGQLEELQRWNLPPVVMIPLQQALAADREAQRILATAHRRLQDRQLAMDALLAILRQIPSGRL